MTMTRSGGLIWIVLLSILLWFVPNSVAAFEFAVMGDQGYDKEAEVKFSNLLEALNRTGLAFAVHVGDLGSPNHGSCTDAAFARRLSQFQESSNPLIYTPGDNEWTDCHRKNAGRYDPLERLARLRAVFFHGDESLGKKTLRLSRQSSEPRYVKYRENAYWTLDGVSFATIHMVGSNNNLGRAPEADAEYRERNRANLAWLKETFARARREASAAVALFTQANPYFEDGWPKSRQLAFHLRNITGGKVSGFDEFRSALEAETIAFGKPVVLFHGDTHYFRIDKPMFTDKKAVEGRGRQVENFTRVEGFGYPEAHWIRVIAQRHVPGVFTFRQEIVQANVVKRVP